MADLNPPRWLLNWAAINARFVAKSVLHSHRGDWRITRFSDGRAAFYVGKRITKNEFLKRMEFYPQFPRTGDDV